MAGRADGEDLAVPVPGLGQETSPALTRRVTTWQGHTRVTEVRAMRQIRTFIQSAAALHIYAS
jgi:hypothetical protein